MRRAVDASLLRGNLPVVAKNVVNLNKFRKQKQRDDRAKQAEVNRVKHGRTKEEKERALAEQNRFARALEGKRLVLPLRMLFNPACSKCRAAKDLLEERGETVELVHYLDATPSRKELEALVAMLGLSSPRGMMRTSEKVYAELALEHASDELLLDAMVAHPILIERPIVVRGTRAVIARPPERATDI